MGLPDCYFEFYDEQNQMGVSYQIDTTDLMCSRAGNFNERLYKELNQTTIDTRNKKPSTHLAYSVLLSAICPFSLKSFNFHKLVPDKTCKDK